MFILVHLVIIFLLLYIAWFYLDELARRKKLPPGPIALPLIGSVIQLARAHSKPHLALVKLAEKYGDVMRVKLGIHEYIILSSAESLNDLLSKDETLGRPDHGILNDRLEVPNTGIGVANGEWWKIKRLWLARTLRELGLGRTSYFQETTRLMISKLQAKLREDMKTKGNVFEVDRQFPLCAATMIWSVLVGSDTPEDEEDCEIFLSANDDWFNNGCFGDGLLLIAPFLKYFIPRITGYTAQVELSKIGVKIAQKWYDKLSKLEIDSVQSIYHSYIMEERKGREGFFMKDFNMTFSDICIAGVDTSTSYLQSLILFLTAFPDKQAKLLNEINRAFPDDHVFSIMDLKHLPYTEAFLLEAHRLEIVATNWAPRWLTADIEYRGYIFKKGTTLLPNPHLAFKDKILFAPDPETFRPERFLRKENANELNDLKSKLTPFSIGKRSCPGEAIAQIISFLVLVYTVKHFELCVVPGEEPPPVEFLVGITSKPKPFKVLVRGR